MLGGELSRLLLFGAFFPARHSDDVLDLMFHLRSRRLRSVSVSVVIVLAGQLLSFRFASQTASHGNYILV